MQHTLPKPKHPGISDVKGLNLVISRPLEIATDTQLPVVVFVHGGGPIGGNWFPQTDCKGIVELSTRLNKPIIGVGIKYDQPSLHCGKSLT